MPLFGWYLFFLKKIVDPTVSIAGAIATAHTIFNVLNVLIFIPFIGYMADFLRILVKDDKEIVTEKITHLDDLMVDFPSVIISQTMEEILEMGKEIQNSFIKLNEIYLNRSLVDKNLQIIMDSEEKLDLYQKEITDINFIILHKGLDATNVTLTRENLIICDEYETISDYLLRISKITKKIINNDIYLDEMRENTIIKLHTEINEIFDYVNEAYRTKNKDLFVLALKKCNNIKGTYSKARKIHLDTLTVSESQTMLSTGYMDMLNSYRRIKEHLGSIIEIFVKLN